MAYDLFITGGAGFVGSNLALRVRRENPKLRIATLDNLKRKGSELNVPRLKKAGIDYFHGDVRNPKDIEAVGAFKTMIECSAEPSVMAGFNESPEYVIHTNLTGTIHCLEAVRKNKADILFLSTSRIYPIKSLFEICLEEDSTRFQVKDTQSIPGISKDGISEEFPIVGRRTFYGATKFSSEIILNEYIETYGLRGVTNRCSVIGGPWQMGKVDQGLVSFWVAAHVYKGSLNYIGFDGHGKQVRDVLHIDDLFDLVKMQIDKIGTISGETFNIGGGRANSISLLELTRFCEEATGNNLKIGSIPQTRDGDVPYYVTDFKKVTKTLGWCPKRDVKTIVQDTVRWMKENKSALQSVLWKKS